MLNGHESVSTKLLRRMRFSQSKRPFRLFSDNEMSFNPKKNEIAVVQPDKSQRYAKENRWNTIPASTPTIKSFVGGFLQQIEKGKRGKRLLSTLLNEANKDIVITLDDKTLETGFSETDAAYNVTLNISDTYTKMKNNQGKIDFYTPDNGVIKRKSVIPTDIKDIRRDVLNIEREQSPSYIAVAHEFNHARHRIDNSNVNSARKNNTGWETEYASDNSRVGGQNVWGDAEEHRNVFSPIDPSSELNLRMEQNLPLRYPYTSTSKFIEPVKTVIRSAIRSEKPVTGTTLRIASSREWLGKLKGLMDKIDPDSQPNDPTSTNPPSNHIGKYTGSIEHTKIKLLPHLFGEGGYPFTPERKQRIVESYTQHLKGKKDNKEAQNFANVLDNFYGTLQVTDKNKKKYKDKEYAINNKFEYMMRFIKMEQDNKTLKEYREQKKNRLGKYSFIPRMLAREIKKGNVQVEESGRRRGNMAGNIIDRTQK